MNDLTMFGMTERELNGLVLTMQIFSKDNGIEFRTKKCGMIIIQKGKVVSSDDVVIQTARKSRVLIVLI